MFGYVTFGFGADATKENCEYFKNFFANFGIAVMLLMGKTSSFVALSMTTKEVTFCFFKLNNFSYRISSICVMFRMMSSILYGGVGESVQEFKSFGLFAALNSAVTFIQLILLILFIAWFCKNPLNILRLRFLPYFIGFRIISERVVLIISFIETPFNI